MKIPITIILIAMLVNNSFSQTSKDISPAQITLLMSKPANFTAISEAKTMIAEIIEVIGLKQNFEVMAANIDNAAAVVYQSKRFILYNPDFINRLDAAAGNKWASVSILAHEVGHHLNGHMLENISSQPVKELEADEFSGFVLRRMGATLAEAQAALKIAANYKKSLTHPGKIERLTGIAGGWNRANVQQGGKDLAKTIPAKKQSDDNVTGSTQSVNPDEVVIRRYPARQPGNETRERNSSLINERYILGEITFAAGQQSSFYLTSQFNIVREMDNRLYSIGKMVKTDNNTYPFIITDDAGTRLWVDSRGNIINGNSKSVGFLKVRK